MSAAELAPLIDALPRIEKFQLLQFLVTSITKEENLPALDPTIPYPLWTPYNTPVETVATLAALRSTTSR
jgi:hypothetical protein